MATPIIVGVADFKYPSAKPENALEPYQLMLNAIDRAITDTYLPEDVGKTLKAAIDSIDVVATWSWPYKDLPGLLSEKLGVDAKHRFISGHGGNQPAKLVDEAAKRIAKGEAKVAIVTGGEALASLSGFMAAGQRPDWKDLDETAKTVTVSDASALGDSESKPPKTKHIPLPSAHKLKTVTGTGAKHGIGLPIHVYPLYENATRAHRGQSIKENHAESAELYAEFAKFAQVNVQSWNFGKQPKTKEEIATVSSKNRMICFPYPLLMNAFNSINLAGAIILTNTDYATELGIPKSQWVYPLGGAGTKDSENFWERPNYHSSPSMSRSVEAALKQANVQASDIFLHDFYSCFPIVPKMACLALGLPIDGHSRPLSLLGGLTSFGGAGNNYSMHAIAEMTRELREKDARQKNGLVLANGGTMTYQHVLILSGSPRKEGRYPTGNPLPDIITDVPVPTILEEAEGAATVETYTVHFARDGSPARAFVLGRLSTGERFVANHGDAKTLSELSSWDVEPVGRAGWVKRSEDGRNLFVFDDKPRL